MELTPTPTESRFHPLRSGCVRLPLILTTLLRAMAGRIQLGEGN